jgi:hypothetical protein
MPAWSFDVKDAVELDVKLRNEIFALDNLGRGNEIYGTVSVVYSEDEARMSSLVAQLESRGVVFVWHKSNE